jgi:hypothetical protein
MIVMMTGMALGVGYHSLCGVLLLFARLDLDCRTEECSLYPQLNGIFKEYAWHLLAGSPGILFRYLFVLDL